MADTNIYTKLREAQLELKVPKSQRNSFGNYNYRSCEDIVETAKPVLNNHGLTLVITDSLEAIGDRYYVKATAAVYDEAGANVLAFGYAREEETKKGMDASQITGAASSYARKYALNGLLAIDDTKDADAQENTKTKPAEKKPAYTSAGENNYVRKPSSTDVASPKQRELIVKKLGEQGVSMEEMNGFLIENFGVTIPLTKEGASVVIEELINNNAAVFA